MFGTIVNGAFIPAPKTLTVDGLVHYHPSDAMYAAAGYLLRVETDRPDGQHVSRYTAIDGQAVQSWEAATPAEEEVSLETRVDALEDDVEQIITGLEGIV